MWVNIPIRAEDTESVKCKSTSSEVVAGIFEGTDFASLHLAVCLRPVASKVRPTLLVCGLERCEEGFMVFKVTGVIRPSSPTAPPTNTVAIRFLFLGAHKKNDLTTGTVSKA